MENLSLMGKVAEVIAGFHRRQKEIVVVHGGGKEISSWLTRIGKEPKFIDGLRYTDEETLEVMEMVLSGLINKRLVSVFGLLGVECIGLSGRDLGILKGQKLPGLGYAGEVVRVKAEPILKLVHQGFLPCLSPVGEDPQGNSLNINADEAARAIAEGLRAEELIYLSDIDGLMIGGKLISICSSKELKAHLSSPEVTGGMRPKLLSTLRALEGGVQKVRFINALRPEGLQQVLSGENDKPGSVFTV